MTILYENDAFSILVLSTNKKYSRFLKKVFVFEKIGFKVKVLKTFRNSTDCHTKACRSLKRRAEYPWYCFLGKHMFFLLVFCLSIWVFFHEYSRITELQEKGKSISLTPHYHFYPLHRHLDINLCT